MKLLIIEDDPDQRELIRETLEERFGAGTVSLASSRAEALTQDLATFDLVLSDYNLPDASGMQLLHDIQQRCNTPVIMVTGENVGRIAAEAIRRGATDYIVKFGDYLFTIPLVVEKNLAVAKVRQENARLHSELELALSAVQEKNAQLEKSLRRIEEVAATDPLTGLYNRRHFGRVIEQLFNEAQRYDNELSCVMIDLDGYKQLNDTLGHQVGDQLLVVAGKVISANMRKMDVAARYGGDEFVLLLPRADVDEAARVAQRIGAEFRQASAILLRRNEGVSMSIGVGSTKCDMPAGTEQLIAAADTALYRAKAGGRNRVELSAGRH
ncbi:MAG TPA: diguanylate cyclase [Tepidisphaeraceae bacterium]|nr:diguanylate cyclase [Tepidisphaeraceae bacterium]